MHTAILKDIDALIRAVNETGSFVAPVEAGSSDSRFRPVASAAGMASGLVNTRLSVKEIFFPQRETLVSFSAGVASVPASPDKPLVVFGVRPCDARSLTFLDKVFSGRSGVPGKDSNAIHEDPYYLGRRANALVISLACDEPCGSCFCTSVGGSPYGTDGSDILASAGREGLMLEAVTEKGDEFLARQGTLLAAAGEREVEDRATRASAAAAKLPVMDFTGMKEKLDASLESPLWESLTRSCLGCGACTYVCPTCHCFDITDESRGDRGVRIRSWDSCQYSLFTVHTSGHNPRPNRRQRMRQRLMHKFSYTVESAGAVFCSGCGRCVRSCPVNLDIRRMLAEIKDTP